MAYVRVTPEGVHVNRSGELLVRCPVTDCNHDLFHTDRAYIMHYNRVHNMRFKRRFRKYLATMKPSPAKAATTKRKPRSTKNGVGVRPPYSKKVFAAITLLHTALSLLEE